MTGRTAHAEGPVPVSLSHVVLRTAHLDDVIDWYGKVVGTHVNYRADSGAALSTDGEHHRIALIAVPPGATNPGAPGLEHLAFKLQSLDHLLGNYTRLREAGIRPFVAVNHVGTVSFYYHDPDGVQVELFVDAMTAEASIEFMAGPDFLANPIGFPFDPEDLVSRYEAGEPIRSLLEPPPFDPAMLEAFFGMSEGVANIAETIDVSGEDR